ncbi:MAG: hypothetical protein RLZZ301_869 [Bacteroidota bacterium]
MSKKKILTVIGARPQIIKAAAISRAIQQRFQHELSELIVHTGQHYDSNMSDVFFSELGIPAPHANLNVGSGSHGTMTAEMLAGLEALILKEKPTAVVVYGDTNSTIAAALAAAKIHVPVVHIEAGLRSFHKAMPEELNRIASDHMSTLLFVPTQAGIDNLVREGFSLSTSHQATIDAPHVYHCGDVMYDNSLYFSTVSDQKSRILERLGLHSNHYVLCTIHRDSNTDDPQKLIGILEALQTIENQHKLAIVLPIHPRTRKMIEQLKEEASVDAFLANPQIHCIEPAGFLDIIALEKHARLIVTDSGGLQKEAFFFQKPCVILREQTEWIEIVENGNAQLCGADTQRICNAATALLEKTDFSYPPLFGDGHAAEFICQKICAEL